MSGIDDYPTDNGRKLCTPEKPMRKEDAKAARWAHTNAVEIRDWDTTRLMRCKDCGVEWIEELPQ